MRKVLFTLAVGLLLGCSPDDEKPGAREEAGGYDLYGLLGQPESRAAETLGEPLEVGERFDYSGRGHTAFTAAYAGGAQATYLLRPSGEGCLVRVEFDGPGERRPSTENFNPSQYGFPPGSVTAGRQGDPRFAWERTVTLQSGRPAFLQEVRSGGAGTGTLGYAIRSEALYEACGLPYDNTMR